MFKVHVALHVFYFQFSGVLVRATQTQIMQDVVRRGAPKSKQLKIYEDTRPLLFCTACEPSISGFKTINFFAPFEIFWVYMSANLICKQTVTVLCEHT